MFKSYNTLAEVPEADREHYKQGADGRFYDEVSDDHPLVVGNRTLKTEKQGAEEKARTAEANLASANVIPRGYEAVPKADAEIAKAAKEAGITKPEELAAIKTEHADLKTQVEVQQRRERLDRVRKRFEWNDNAVQVLELIKDLPDIEDRDVTTNGKTEKMPHAKIKVGEEVTFQPFDKYFEETHAALVPAVKTVQQYSTKVHGSTGGGGTSAGNFYDGVRENVTTQEKAQASDSKALEQRLHIAA